VGADRLASTGEKNKAHFSINPKGISVTNPFGQQVPPPPQRDQFAPPPPPVMAVASMEQRRFALANAITREVALGARVETQTDVSAVLVRGSKCNHTLHLILTIFTCGIWSIGWAIIAAVQKEHRSTLIVNEFGQVQIQRLN
jgi:hypothetical protein